MRGGREIRQSTIVALGVILTACSTAPTQSPTSSVVTATKPDTGSASVVAKVDCGDDGAADVTITYGTRPVQNIQVRKSAGTAADGASKTVSNRYSAYPGPGGTELTVTTSPTSGSCRTTLTDFHTGNVLDQRDGAACVVVKAVVPGGG